VTTVYPEFNIKDYLAGRISPVFFGSAVNNFGVKELLDCFVRISPEPMPRETAERVILPNEKKFSGFVFKIHANIDPRHRDRIAFVRVVSGKFERNKLYHLVRQNKDLKFSNPYSFLAAKKEVVDEAYPGDIVGLYDSGNFKIGDSITEGEKLHFKGIPAFSPEQFRFVNNTNPLKTKQLNKGIEQLMDEGVAQLFIKEDNGRKIIGTVGALQFDVIQYRLEHEYGASCSYEPLPLFKACWVKSDDPLALKEFVQRRKKDIAVDKDGKMVYLAESPWALRIVQENHPKIVFRYKSEE
jgi:peptide chain release factor 3